MKILYLHPFLISSMEEEKIYTVCPKCLKITEGYKSVHNNCVWIKSDCKEHDLGKQLYFPDSNYYQRLKKLTCGYDPRILIDLDKDNILDFKDLLSHTHTLHINLTNRCNLKCPTCFARERSGNFDLSFDEIKSRLEPIISTKFRPMIVLVGGEPTLHPELVDIIKYLKKNNFIVRLSTNGIRMANYQYIKELKDAGLDWILLQFDGFDPAISEKIRGNDLIDIKEKVIHNAKKLGIFVHLITMITHFHTADCLRKLIHFAYQSENIYALNFYPASNLGINEFEVISTIKILDLLSDATDNSINRENLLRQKRFFNLLYKITKKTIYRQVICTFPTYIFIDKTKIYSIFKLINPIYVLTHFKLFLRFLRNLRSLLNFSSSPSNKFLYLSIEKFYDYNALDLEEAAECHNVYLSKKGLIPFCLYNILFNESSYC